MEWLIALGIGAAAALPVLAIAWSLATTDPPDERFEGLFDPIGHETPDDALSMWSGIPAREAGAPAARRADPEIGPASEVMASPSGSHTTLRSR